ncbi:MAG: ADP-glyceromanno-heptose 6-epimerase [Spirochaetota bacterium]|nr:ADP-glyceromanno-heptose 6-epimerase [Spirochaetota bacterium]
MIIVTGGAGFIGSAFVWKLNSEGIKDIIIVDELGVSDKWKNLVKRKFQDYICKDDFLNILKDGKLDNISAIVHMGACSSTTEQDADYLMKNNYLYTKELAEWSIKNKARFIYASSAATYGDGSHTFSDDDATTLCLQPLNIYGYSKQIFDLYGLQQGLLDRIVGLKFFNVFGPNEYHKDNMVSVVYRTFHQVKDTGNIKLFKSYNIEYRDGEQKRDFIYIKDCIDVIWWLLQNSKVNGIYNLGSGKARTWNDLAKSVFTVQGKELSIQYIDMPENLKDRYQYFTEAKMKKLRLAGCPLNFHTLEEAVKDYIVNYLQKDDQYL